MSYIDYITDDDFDICAITESWLAGGETDACERADVTCGGVYKLTDIP